MTGKHSIDSMNDAERSTDDFFVAMMISMLYFGWYASRMAIAYKLTATPFLLSEGDGKAHLETVTFVAEADGDTHKWWSVNLGSYESDFGGIVHSSAAKEIVRRLRDGETVVFPGRYELNQLTGFGGRWGD